MSSRTKNVLLVVFAIIIIILLGFICWRFFMTRSAGSPMAATATSTPIATSASTTPSQPLHLMESGQYYTIDLEYPDTDPAITAILKQYAQKTAANFIAESGVASITPQDAQMIGLDANNKYTLTSTYQTYNSSTTVSYVFTVYEDTFGAHPITTYDTFTFNTQTHQQLSLGDLFTPGTDYLDQLSKISRPLLVKQQGEDSDETDFIDPGTTATAVNFHEFAIDGKNLDIFFDPYQVAPYALGPQMVKIPLVDLLGLYSNYYI